MKPSDPNTRRDGEEPKAPVKLVTALKEPSARRVFMPPSMDAAVLRAAQQHFAKPQPAFTRFLRPWFIWPTTATACLALAGLAFFATRSPQPQFAREDINRDGRVDILDAFQLAREIQSGANSAPTADLNNDGIVDRRDAELIATYAVRLEKGGKS